MKLFRRKNTGKSIKNVVFVAGALFVYVVTFNSIYADGLKGGFNSGAFKKKGSCNLKCKPDDPKNPKGPETCVFVPTGCNNANKLGVPKRQLEQLITPQLVNPQLILPKRKFLPGDAFKPNKLPK